MKYENFGQVAKIIEQIEKHQQKLDTINDCLSSGTLVVGINTSTSRESNRIYTISPLPSSEHEYATPARVLINFIQTDLELRIDNLKSMLEEL